ncbi:MAG: hypothetical protein ACLPV8_25480 [Steroidobacteraceae bacterium]
MPIHEDSAPDATETPAQGEPAAAPRVAATESKPSAPAKWLSDALLRLGEAAPQGGLIARSLGRLTADQVARFKDACRRLYARGQWPPPGAIQEFWEHELLPRVKASDALAPDDPQAISVARELKADGKTFFRRHSLLSLIDALSGRGETAAPIRHTPEFAPSALPAGRGADSAPPGFADAEANNLLWDDPRVITALQEHRLAGHVAIGKRFAEFVSHYGGSAAIMTPGEFSQWVALEARRLRDGRPQTTRVAPEIEMAARESESIRASLIRFLQTWNIAPESSSVLSPSRTGARMPPESRSLINGLTDSVREFTEQLGRPREIVAHLPSGQVKMRLVSPPPALASQPEGGDRTDWSDEDLIKGLTVEVREIIDQMKRPRPREITAQLPSGPVKMRVVAAPAARPTLSDYAGGTGANGAIPIKALLTAVRELVREMKQPRAREITAELPSGPVKMRVLDASAVQR